MLKRLVGWVILCTSLTNLCNGCEIEIVNRFTDQNGLFEDVCGATLTNPVSDLDLSTNNGIYTISSSSDIIKFGDARWDLDGGDAYAIIIEAQRTVSTTSGFDIILGPGDGNCQIRYEDSNDICIYSNYGTSSFSFYDCATLPYDVDTLHTIILYNTGSSLQIYQNNDYVTTISKSLTISLSTIGAWFGTQYRGDIAVKNIMLIMDSNITSIRNCVSNNDWPETCVGNATKSYTPSTTTANPSTQPTSWLTEEPTIAPDGCGIFTNRFTDQNGVFQDICGSITLRQVSGDLSTDNGIYEVSSTNDIVAFSPMWELDGEYTIVIESRRTTSSGSFDIILGPSGQINHQIRYESSNNLCIYATGVWGCTTLPDDVDEFHTLILYNNDNELQIYQNNQYVATYNSLSLSVGRIGGWFGNQYQGDIAVKNIMLALGVSLDTIKNYVHYGLTPDVSTINPTYSMITTSYPTTKPTAAIPTFVMTSNLIVTKAPTRYQRLTENNQAIGNETENGDINTTLIVVIAIVVLLILGAFIAWICYRKSKREYFAAPVSEINTKSDVTLASFTENEGVEGVPTTSQTRTAMSNSTVEIKSEADSLIKDNGRNVTPGYNVDVMDFQNTGSY